MQVCGVVINPFRKFHRFLKFCPLGILSAICNEILFIDSYVICNIIDTSYTLGSLELYFQ